VGRLTGWWLAAVVTDFVWGVWGWLRRWCGGRCVTGLTVAYFVGSVVWVAYGCPGPWPAVVAFGCGWVLLMVGSWVEQRTRALEAAWRVEVARVVEQETADLDGRWREIRADAEWVRDGFPEV
jgi:hypothetical protein